MLLLEPNYKGLGALKAGTLNGTFSNFGCDVSKRAELIDREEKLTKMTLTNGLIAEANIVLICDGTSLGEGSAMIRANKVVLAGLNASRSGQYGIESFSIEAGELVLEGANDISSLAPDGAPTLFSGPSLKVEAAKLSGEGTLEITSIGSSYIAPTK